MQFIENLINLHHYQRLEDDFWIFFIKSQAFVQSISTFLIRLCCSILRKISLIFWIINFIFCQFLTFHLKWIKNIAYMWIFNKENNYISSSKCVDYWNYCPMARLFASICYNIEICTNYIDINYISHDNNLLMIYFFIQNSFQRYLKLWKINND